MGGKKEGKPAYEPPKAMRLGDSRSGAGDCTGGNSDSGETCYETGGAAITDCSTTGGQATHDCDITGNSATGYCFGTGGEG
jgi:hypothetical protein